MRKIVGRIEDELHRQLRMKLLGSGETIQAFIEAAVRAKVEDTGELDPLRQIAAQRGITLAELVKGYEDYEYMIQEPQEGS